MGAIKLLYHLFSNSYNWTYQLAHGIAHWYNRYMTYPLQLKKEAQKLRSLGRTYNEIRAKIGSHISKSTLSEWCQDVILPQYYQDILAKKMIEGGHKGRIIALATNRLKRKVYLENIYSKNAYFSEKILDKDFAKLALAMLYLGEGSKKISRGALSFGNSDVHVIRIFLRLLRYCYAIDEKKLRCTLQCRADQNTKKLESYWLKVTGIPRNQLYKVQIDKRTIGKPSKKKDYKGVCKIDYFSAHLFHELRIIANIVTGKEGPMV